MTGLTEVFRGPFMLGSNAGGSHHIDTEMVSLNLQGGGLTLKAGDGIGNLSSDGPLFSPGRIDEIAGGILGHSFFDVFFELSPTPFGPLHNNNPLDNILGQQPCVMFADIDRVAPITTPPTRYRGCDADRRQHVPGDLFTPDVIDLYDASGVHRAILTDVVFHDPVDVPEPSSLFLLGSGLVALSVMARRVRRK